MLALRSALNLHSLRYHNSTYKTGIMLLNMGGCDNLEGIPDYLTNIFTDQDIMKLPFSRVTGKLLSLSRSSTVAQYYKAIGGGSPIRQISEKQAKIISTNLNDLFPASAPHKVYVGFRYSPPIIDEAYEAMERDGITRAVALSFYPQYSCTTTGSSLNYLADLALKKHSSILWSLVDRWPTEKFFIKFLVDRLRESIQKVGFHKDRPPVIVFTAHSLPLKAVEKGDPYIAEVFATAANVMQKLNVDVPYRVSWQSKIGPTRWMIPSVKQVITNLAVNGHSNIILAPLVFSADCSETLYELDIFYKDLAFKSGFKKFDRIPVPNLDEEFLKGISKLTGEHIAQAQDVSNHWKMRCPSCRNPRCMKSRAFFCNHSAKLSSSKVQEDMSVKTIQKITLKN